MTLAVTQGLAFYSGDPSTSLRMTGLGAVCQLQCCIPDQLQRCHPTNYRCHPDRSGGIS